MFDLVIRSDRVVTPLGVGAHDVLIAGGKGYTVGTALDRVLPVLKDPAQWPKDARVHYAVALVAAEVPTVVAEKAAGS